MKNKTTFIGIFGRTNTGKSSLINAITKQNIAIVSDSAGTTTDPVKKSIEIIGIGATVIVDTAGIDDYSAIGKLRITKTMEVLDIIDIALFVCSGNSLLPNEIQFLQILQERNIAFIIVYNKSDLNPISNNFKNILLKYDTPLIECSAINNIGIDELIQNIININPNAKTQTTPLIGDLIKAKDLVLLVMPQDSEAPTGRLILPQVQVIRDILDHNAMALCIQTDELEVCLKKISPDLIITDSKEFKQVAQIVPEDILLTSFSIILARQKGYFKEFLKGTQAIEKLKDGDKILILESCTHTSSCEDIGTVKMPQMLRKYTSKELKFELISALAPLPNDLSQYALAIQCGGCMITKKQLAKRINKIIAADLAITNYGIAIAYVNGIFNRAIKIFQK